jgi:rSAM-associated Gly-rich repeat protein
MKISNLTWLGFFLTLSSLTISSKVLAVDSNNINPNHNIEARLNRISEALKTTQNKLPENTLNYPDEEILLGGFVNGGGGFRNAAGGGFLNNRGWADGGGGFLNRR